MTVIDDMSFQDIILYFYIYVYTVYCILEILAQLLLSTRDTDSRKFVRQQKHATNAPAYLYSIEHNHVLEYRYFLE